MEFPNAIKWTVTNRLLAAGAALAGIGLVLVGFVLGFWGAIELLIDNPLDPQPAVERANPVLTLAFAVLGFVVWQIGKTYALFRTLPRASGRAAARRFDHERVKSDVLDGLDDRLTKIEDDLEETRRGVQELKREQHATAFEPEGTSLAAGASAENETSTASGSADDSGRTTADVDRAASDGTDTRSTSGGTDGTDTPADTADDAGATADGIHDADSAGEGAAGQRREGDSTDADRSTGDARGADRGRSADDGPAAESTPSGERTEFTFGAVEPDSESDDDRTDASAADDGESAADGATGGNADGTERTASDSGNDPLA